MFVGSGAPKGKELEIPGRHDTDQIFIGIEWLESIHFGHVDVGRQARAHHRRRQHRDGLLPLGQAPGRHRREGHRAQDAQVLQGVAVGARGRRGRRRRDPREPAAGALHHRERHADRDGVRQVQVGREADGKLQAGDHRPRDHPVRHASCSPSARTTRSPGSSGHRPRVRQVGHAGRGQDDASCRRVRACSSAATRRSARPNIIWAVEHGHQAAISIHNHCQGDAGHRAAGAGHDADEHEDGAARVGVQQQLRPGASARRCSTSSCRCASPSMTHRGREGLHAGADARAKWSAASTATCRRTSCRLAVHRVRRLHRHLPGRLPDDHAERRGTRPARAVAPRRPTNPEQAAVRVRTR